MDLHQLSILLAGAGSGRVSVIRGGETWRLAAR